MVDPTSKDVRVAGGGGPGEIAELEAEFIQPGAGSFGRDKNVEFRGATHAKVRYRRDRSYLDETVTVSQAVALIEQAERDGQAAAARAHEAAQRRQDEATEVQRKLSELACPICGGRDFDEQTAREDSQWGMTTMRMRMLICRRCAFVMQFALGRSLFVPGGNS